MMVRVSGRWLVLIGLTVFVAGVVILTLERRDDTEAEVCSPAGELVLLSEAQQKMAAYLTNAGIKAEIQVQEEGSFMLGAYPRSSALWSIHILEPRLETQDTRLKNIAATAQCIRSGWVWLQIHTPGGASRLVTFSQESLEPQESP